MLLVTGPTGNVGIELVRLLAEDTRTGRWRVGSRHPERVDGGSAERVLFDFHDATTWPMALEGVTSLFLLFPLPSNSAVRQTIIPFIAAAQDAGCAHVVYVSVFGADRARFIPHYAVEKALRESPMASTVLRCSFFMQNLHRTISTHGVDIVERSELFIPAGGGRTTFLDARDAAAVAAIALENPVAHRDTVHHLTGPAALTMHEVAEVLTTELGYPVRYTRPGLMAFARRLRRRRVGWDAIGFMSMVYSLTRFGANQQITDEVAQITSRPARDLAQFVTDSAWRWRDQLWT